MNGVLHRSTFRAMGTVCTVAATARKADERRARRALAAARAEIEACEKVLSRFDPASDLSSLNRRAGEWVDVDPRLVEALAVAIEGRDATGGRFDPTILPALVAAGYDRSFEELAERAPLALADWRAGAEIEVDSGTNEARVQTGAAVDLGAVGKGYSAERALLAMREGWDRLPGALVDLGGDVATWGVPPDDVVWRIAVADPRHSGSTLGVLGLEDGGVATSGRNARRFGPARSLHHLIDPATGVPAHGGPLAVTVVAPDAARAEIHATAFAISSLSESRAGLAEHPELSALFVPVDGSPVRLGPFPLETALADVAA
jgi:thiamine biosynthesis lipoprotein